MPRENCRRGDLAYARKRIRPSGVLPSLHCCGDIEIHRILRFIPTELTDLIYREMGINNFVSVFAQRAWPAKISAFFVTPLLSATFG